VDVGGTGEESSMSDDSNSVGNNSGKWTYSFDRYISVTCYRKI
jgi:hypothetical protein